MGVIPRTRVGKIEFYESHLASWAANAEQIGLSDAKVLTLQTLLQNARGSWLEAETAREASKAATLTFHGDTDRMGTIGAAMLGIIRAHAQSSGDPGVYALAQIPTPGTHAPLAPPGQPYEPRIALGQTGSLTLTWACDNPPGSQGTVYEVRRRIGQEPFTFIEVAGEKSFEDRTIPAGSTGIVYQITPIRGKTRGTPAQFLVNFGNANGNAGGSANGNDNGITAQAVTDGDAGGIRLAA